MKQGDVYKRQIYGCVFSKNYEDNLNYKIETDNLIDHRQSSIAIDKFK